MATTGFSVKHETTGETGITTAAHVPDSGPDRIVDGTETVVWLDDLEDEHKGRWGDMEWWTTTSEDENVIKWEDTNPATDTREITRVERSTGFTKNTIYCNHGQKTGRHCDRVKRISVWKPGVRRLVQMKEDKKKGGDSGCPWFTGSKAAGIHQGNTWGIWGGKRDVFTKADLFDDGLDVRVLTE